MPRSMNIERHHTERGGFDHWLLIDGSYAEAYGALFEDRGPATVMVGLLIGVLILPPAEAALTATAISC